jgi:hypothetical protein
MVLSTSITAIKCCKTNIRDFAVIHDGRLVSGHSDRHLPNLVRLETVPPQHLLGVQTR